MNGLIMSGIWDSNKYLETIRKAFCMCGLLQGLVTNAINVLL